MKDGVLENTGWEEIAREKPRKPREVASKSRL